jgi:NADPH:quinone reductase
MKAIVISEPGGPEAMHLENVAEPMARPGEIVARVVAAGVNFIDTYHRTALYPMDFPLVPGLEGAGVVVDAGESEEFSLGDRIGWVSAMGSYAELLAVPVEQAIPVPQAVDAETAAAVLLQGITAHYLAMDTYPLSAGDTCLIHAGAGGVGLLLTQIAARRGARVITTVGTHEKAELSRNAGAGDVIVYTETNFKDAVEGLVGPNALDVVYDGVGKATFEQSMDLLRPRGMMVTFGNSSGPVPEIAPLTLAQKGSIFLTRPTIAHYLQTRTELMGRVNDLFAWISQGDLDVHIGQRFPLSEAAEAHRALEGRRTTGKVLLIP